MERLITQSDFGSEPVWSLVPKFDSTTGPAIKRLLQQYFALWFHEPCFLQPNREDEQDNGAMAVMRRNQVMYMGLFMMPTTEAEFRKVVTGSSTVLTSFWAMDGLSAIQKRKIQDVYRRMITFPHSDLFDKEHMKDAAVLSQGYVRGWQNMTHWERLNYCVAASHVDAAMNHASHLYASTAHSLAHSSSSVYDPVARREGQRWQ